jgi:hypothetical protein
MRSTGVRAGAMDLIPDTSLSNICRMFGENATGFEPLLYTREDGETGISPIFEAPSEA